MTQEEQNRNALVRGLAAIYRAAVLDVLMNRYRWSAETAARAADDIETAVRARAGQPPPSTPDGRAAPRSAAR
jgi:hypothetical protein